MHPFREGNGRTLRLFIDEVAYNAGYILNWEKVERGLYIKASIDGFEGLGNLMVQLFTDITETIDKRISRNHSLDSIINIEKTINTNLLEKTIQYIDAIEQYKIVLNKIYEEGVAQIRSELSISLKEQKQEIIKLAYRIHEDEVWEKLHSKIIFYQSDLRNTDNLKMIKSDIIEGRVTNKTLNTIYNLIKVEINANKKVKSIKHSQKI